MSEVTKQEILEILRGTCSKCYLELGAGFFRCEDCEGLGAKRCCYKLSCSQCAGTGYFPCKACNASGYIACPACSDFIQKQGGALVDIRDIITKEIYDSTLITTQRVKILKEEKE